MRFSTDDGRFGFIVAPMNGRHMFRFQMIIDGRVIGDANECILGSAMAGLTNLKRLEDERLTRISRDPAAVLSLLRFDEALHDDAVLSLAESLDAWLICGYVFGGSTTFLAQEYRDSELFGPVLISIVPVPEYEEIVNAARSYWKQADRAEA